MSPLLVGWLAGLATIPALAVLTFLTWVALRRSTTERVWCDICPDLPDGRPAYAVTPAASRLPAWMWALSWRNHERSPGHRQAYARARRVAAALNAYGAT